MLVWNSLLIFWRYVLLLYCWTWPREMTWSRLEALSSLSWVKIRGFIFMPPVFWVCEYSCTRLMLLLLYKRSVYLLHACLEKCLILLQIIFYPLKLIVHRYHGRCSKEDQTKCFWCVHLQLWTKYNKLLNFNKINMSRLHLLIQFLHFLSFWSTCASANFYI